MQIFLRCLVCKYKFRHSDILIRTGHYSLYKSCSAEIAITERRCKFFTANYLLQVRILALSNRCRPRIDAAPLDLSEKRMPWISPRSVKLLQVYTNNYSYTTDTFSLTSGKLRIKHVFAYRDFRPYKITFSQPTIMVATCVTIQHL